MRFTHEKNGSPTGSKRLKLAQKSDVPPVIGHIPYLQVFFELPDSLEISLSC